MSSLKHALRFFCLTIVIAVLFSFSVERRSGAQALYKGSPDDVWTRVDEKSQEVDTLILKPATFAAFALDASKLEAILRRAPIEFTADAKAREVVLTLPLPTGGFGHFRIEESPIVAPKLAERYPSLKSYSAKGLDDRTATARFEFTPEGFRSMVISESGTFYVDPASKQDQRRYISYYKTKLPRDPSGFQCYVNNPRPKAIKPRPPPYPQRKRNHALPAAGDSDLRIYRIAVAASSEYVAAIHQHNPLGNPLTQALIAIQRTINRVNLIYERELGVRLELIADEPAIIYLTPVGDPYNLPLATLDQLLDLNQKKTDDVIGWDNYDVGHLFLAHGGGVADEPCACNDWYKADGLTGRANPQGDAFDVDYVAHELGHQFGASHSFNGTTGGCKFRNADTAYEPGSGSTIMGYASASHICGAENVQDFSDDYFHAISLREINSFITNLNPQMGDSCARKVASNNFSRPVVHGPGDYVIPKGTPFTLTAKSGSDGDGDALVYNWEEFDLGDPDPPKIGGPNESAMIRPIFRSRKWGSGLSRTFPQLVNLLQTLPGTTYTAESLPMNKRTMIFRVTARDGRGRYGYDDSQITVVAARRVPGRITAVGPLISIVPVGPFVVTQPASGLWRRGSPRLVSWQVANTNLAPVRCDRVTISLLIRGDEDHPIVLASKVPNNGSRSVVMPANTPLRNARVKVEAVGNIFFNVTAGDVGITQ